MTPQVKSWAVTQADTPPGSQDSSVLLCHTMTHYGYCEKMGEGLALQKMLQQGMLGSRPRQGRLCPPHRSPGAIIPVTMMVRMPVFLRVWITGVVCGFSRFRMTSSPRRLSSCSTVSLEG